MTFTQKLVTVVTATWGRPKTIFEHAIPSVDAQDYPDVEHLIVTDGRDPDLEAALGNAGYSHGGTRRRLVSLGRNWTGFSGDGGIGAVPRLVGSWMAAGEYVTYLDDDNDYLPGHLSSLAGALSETGADIAFCAWRDGPGGPVQGSPVPGPGTVDTSSFMHRAGVLRHGSWQLDGYGGDHLLVERWVNAGVTYTWVPEPTMILNDHRRGAPD